MNDIERFLNEFRRLETALRNTDTADSVLDYENSISKNDADVSDKLKLCRIVRNYISHHPAEGSKNFVVPTGIMIKFISEQADAIEAKEQHARDIMTRVKSITPDTGIKDVLFTLSKAKHGWLAITDKSGRFTGMIDSNAFVSLIAKKQSLTGKLSSVITDAFLKKSIKECNLGIVYPSDPAEKIMSEGYDRIVVCADDMIYKGIIK